MTGERLTLDELDAQELQRRWRAATTPQRDAQRAQVILLLAQGLKRQAIAEQSGLSVEAIRRWYHRFQREGLDGLRDQPGRGRKPSLPAEALALALEKVTQPPLGQTRWSCRSMAKLTGLSKASVQRLWAANDIKPHLTRSFKLSTDPQFEAKFWDVIGLYLAPPEQALVLCCDEKTQVQALERTQPSLPLGIGHIRTQTHDYVRHGTLTLFTALDYLNGRLIANLQTQHRHQEWLVFLKKINRETPKDLQLHLIVDNYATHKHPVVRAWLAKHPRFHLHFTPTSSSWLNLVERFFREVTAYVREGSFQSVRELSAAIEVFLALRNANPTRYVWRAKGEDILRKIQRARTALAAQAEVNGI